MRCVVVVLILLLSACGPSIGSAEVTVSAPTDGDIPVATTQSALLLLQTSTSEAVQQSIVNKGQVFTVPNPSRVAVVRNVPGSSVVPAATLIRILTGPHANVEGWVPSEWVQKE